jgi:hypothetical protein
MVASRITHRTDSSHTIERMVNKPSLLAAVFGGSLVGGLVLAFVSHSDIFTVIAAVMVGFGLMGMGMVMLQLWRFERPYRREEVTYNQAPPEPVVKHEIVTRNTGTSHRIIYDHLGMTETQLRELYRAWTAHPQQRLTRDALDRSKFPGWNLSNSWAGIQRRLRDMGWADNSMVLTDEGCEELRKYE